MIGAGFATGREVAAFFSQYGAWSWLGVAAAVGTLALLGQRLAAACRRRQAATLADCFPGGLGWIARGAFLLLLLTTGGAMTAGAAELAELTLPFHGALWVGGLGTLGCSWLLSRRESNALTALSAALMAALTALMGLCWLLSPEQGYTLGTVSRLPAWLEACGRGLCWGGFNLAFAAPLVCRNARERRAPRLAAILLGGLLLLGNGLLLRHAALWNHPLPMVALLARLGAAGYALGAAALYLAMLTTLIAVLRGLRDLLPVHMAWKDGAALAGVAAVSAVSFQEIVGVGYPLLGAACLCLLAAAALGAREA